jgi:cell division protein FtsW (lipid II flippase)
MARGGLIGQNWGHSLWSNSFLPLPYSDSAFASLVEAIGFLGSIPVIISFCILTFAGYKLGIETPERINKTFILSIIFLITFQALLHISVNVTMLPATGITLPLFSYGGSSMIATMLSIGMMLSAARDNYLQ